jgi:hypothetical protein
MTGELGGSARTDEFKHLIFEIKKPPLNAKGSVFSFIQIQHGRL